MKLIPFLLVLPLLTSCGGLSEDAKRAAAAHADNMCRLAQLPADNPFGGQEFVQAIANGGDVHAWADKGEDGQTLKEANRIARERGCIK